MVGVLTLYHAAKDAFTRDHLRILLAVTHKIALSIENALRYRQAETSAVTDALTGLPNARSLFLHLDGEIARCKREQSPLTILVCDLDGFKQVNDRFGHLEGNKVLRTVAQGLQENCREYDYVARMGGDEFVVLLPGHPADAVQAKVEQLSEIATEAGKLHCGENLLAMSVGAAVFLKDGSDAEQLLASADRAMYQAKQGVWHLKSAKRNAKAGLGCGSRTGRWGVGNPGGGLLLVPLTILAGGLLAATMGRLAPGFGTDERELEARP